MHVTYVTSGLDTGGAEFALLRLLPAMREFSVDSGVISLRSMGMVGPLLQNVGVPVVSLGLPGAFASLKAPSKLFGQVRDWQPGLIHGWMYHGNLTALAAARRVGAPVVWGIRQSLGVGARDKWLTRQLIRVGAMLSHRANSIVYNSATARRQHEARGYAALHGAVIPNGFDTAELRPDEFRRLTVRRELGLDGSVLVVAQVARFHAAKDYPTFLRAAARLAERVPSAVFMMVGQGVDESNRELVALVQELGLGERVRMLGRRDDIARLMPAFDVVCLTSSGEGFPNVIGEAMSCGVPCVGTSVGDMAELIGDTGEIVPVSEPAAVAAAVGRLLALEPEVRRALGARARERIIQRFSIREVARQYADLLLAVASNPR